jgi:ornithine decarboxylase
VSQRGEPKGRNYPPLVEVENQASIQRFAREEAFRRNATGNQVPFETLNLSQMARRLELWQDELPQVEPFYAVKVNEHPLIIQTAAALGLGFDCASKGELELVLDAGVHPHRIVNAHTVKPSSHLQFARYRGITLGTFDSVEELEKVRQWHPDMKLILRVAVENKFTDFAGFDRKFGTKPEEFEQLLVAAKQLKISVIGCSFHIGSYSSSGIPYQLGIELARQAMGVGNRIGHHMHVLDIGGGFPGSRRENDQFREFAAVAREAISRNFSDVPQLRLIAEPGTFFSQSSMTLYTPIVGRKAVPATAISRDESHSTETGYMYYITEGVYGTFLDCLLVRSIKHDPEVIFQNQGEEPRQNFWSKIWGPSCDPGDEVLPCHQLPFMEEGDWLEFADKGAYSHCFHANFNGFPPPDLFAFYEERDGNIFAKIADR